MIYNLRPVSKVRSGRSCIKSWSIWVRLKSECVFFLSPWLLQDAHTGFQGGLSIAVKLSYHLEFLSGIPQTAIRSVFPSKRYSMTIIGLLRREVRTGKITM